MGMQWIDWALVLALPAFMIVIVPSTRKYTRGVADFLKGQFPRPRPEVIRVPAAFFVRHGRNLEIHVEALIEHFDCDIGNRLAGFLIQNNSPYFPPALLGKQDDRNQKNDNCGNDKMSFHR